LQSENLKTKMIKTPFYAFLWIALFATTAIAQPPMGFPPFGGGGPGFSGGPPMSGGFSRGDRGDRGGDRGDRGDRSGGGFDPSSFLTRMDSNGNGMLDPEEAQGPARFMLDRLARDNPKIDVSKPIPMSTLTEAFQRMRGGSSSSSFGSSGGEEEFIMAPEKSSLVPGFESKKERIPVPGFGISAEQPTIKIEEQDLKEAEERIKRYDRNNDQVLDENEIKEGRWSDSPLQFDRNKDGKLSLQEMATRQARRRTVSTDQQQQTRRDDPRSSRKKELVDDKKEKEKPGVFDKKSSYRIVDKDGKPVRPSGLPEWFSSKDANQDNQVSMSEFGRKWDQDALDDYYRFDSNRDGLITARECLAAVKQGYIPGAASSTTVSSTSSTGPTSSATTASTAKPAVAAVSGGGAAPQLDDRMRAWAEKQLKKLDKDNNGSLSPDEFTEGDFSAVDSNKDGRVDAQEYAAFRAKR
jgi:Ca2+-binding EF-hand superfamily protein